MVTQLIYNFYGLYRLRNTEDLVFTLTFCPILIKVAWTEINFNYKKSRSLLIIILYLIFMLKCNNIFYCILTRTYKCIHNKFDVVLHPHKTSLCSPMMTPRNRQLPNCHVTCKMVENYNNKIFLSISNI